MTRKLNLFIHVALTTVVCTLAIGCSTPGPAEKTAAPPSAPTTVATSPEHQQVINDWEKVINAAKQERELVWSVTQAQDWQDAVAKLFQETYGIEVHISVTRPPDMLARFTSELAAG